MLAALSVGGIAALTIASRSTMSPVLVNGPVYATIVDDKDLLADVLPPPEFILEAHLNSYEVAGAANAQQAGVLAARAEKLRKDFEDRQTYWKDRLAPGEARDLLLGEAASSAREYFSVREQELVPAATAGQFDKARAVVRDRLDPIYAKHRQAIDRCVELATASAASHEKSAAETIATAKATQWGIAGVVGVCVGLVAFLIARSITRPIATLGAAVRTLAAGDLTARAELNQRDELGALAQSLNESIGSVRAIITEAGQASRQVAAAATQIAASGEEMATGLKSQEEQATQVSAAVQQMSASVIEVAKKSADAAGAAEHAGKDASTGGEVVQSTVTEMKGIADQVNQSATAVTDLGKKSEQIGQIIGVINDIADQTNLLALNAAIEAARAGEHGRGFAVVADEVRKLAERTTQATDEVAKSIREIQSETGRAVERINQGTQRVSKGVDLANSAGQALSRIVAGAQSVQAMVQSIAAAAEEQSAASGQIARAVESISSVTRESNQAANQAAQAAADLSTQAEKLNALVGRFKI